MTDLETRIDQWVDAQTADVEPVSLNEIRERATTIPLDADPLPAPPRRFHPRPLAVAAAVILIAAAIGAAILLLDTDDDPPVVTEDGEEGLGVYLDLIPDDPATAAGIRLIDLEGPRASTGIPRPASDLSVEDSVAFLDAVGATNGATTRFPDQLVGRDGSDTGGAVAGIVVQNTRTEIGIDPSQITSWASWTEPGATDDALQDEDEVLVLTGRFDPAEVERAATRTSAAAGDATVHEHRDVRYFGWSDRDQIDILGWRPSGLPSRPHQIALVGDHLIVTNSHDAMEELIDRVLDGRQHEPRHAGYVETLHAVLDQGSDLGPVWNVTLVTPAIDGRDGLATIGSSTLGVTSWRPPPPEARLVVFAFDDEGSGAEALIESYEPAIELTAEWFTRSGDRSTEDEMSHALKRYTMLRVDAHRAILSQMEEPDPWLANEAFQILAMHLLTDEGPMLGRPDLGD